MTLKNDRKKCEDEACGKMVDKGYTYKGMFLCDDCYERAIQYGMRQATETVKRQTRKDIIKRKRMYGN